MSSLHYSRLVVLSLLLVFICVVRSAQVSIDEQRHHGDNRVLDQATLGARLRLLQQVLSRRSLYDPAFGDSWSSYFERKRDLFDPAYSDWANSFKRSDHEASN